MKANRRALLLGAGGAIVVVIALVIVAVNARGGHTTATAEVSRAALTSPSTTGPTTTVGTATTVTTNPKAAHKQSTPQATTEDTMPGAPAPTAVPPTTAASDPCTPPASALNNVKYVDAKIMFDNSTAKLSSNADYTVRFENTHSIPVWVAIDVDAVGVELEGNGLELSRYRPGASAPVDLPMDPCGKYFVMEPHETYHGRGEFQVQSADFNDTILGELGTGAAKATFVANYPGVLWRPAFGGSPFGGPGGAITIEAADPSQ